MLTQSFFLFSFNTFPVEQENKVIGDKYGIHPRDVESKKYVFLFAETNRKKSDIKC